MGYSIDVRGGRDPVYATPQAAPAASPFAPTPSNPNPFGNAGGPAPQVVNQAPAPPGFQGSLPNPMGFGPSNPTGGINGSPGTPAPPGVPGPQPQGVGSAFNWGGTLPGDFDISTMGAGEQQWQQTGQQWQQPTANENVFQTARPELEGTMMGQGYIQNALPGIAQPGVGQQFVGAAIPGMQGHMGGGNNVSQVFGDYQRTAGAPGMDAYYENETRKALERINGNAASRGIYGSSAALAEGNEAITNLAADQARVEAQYNLDRLRTGAEIGRSAEDSQLGWTQGLGDLGLRAEETDLARQLTGVKAADLLDRTRLEQLGLLGDFADNASDSFLDRLTGGQNAAIGAQRAEEDRVELGFDAALRMGKEVQAAATNWLEQLTQDQLDLFANSREAALASLATALGYDEYERKQHEDEMNQWLSFWGMGKNGAGSKIGGGGGG